MQRRTFHRWTPVAVVLAAVLALTACVGGSSGSDGDGTPKAGGSLVVGLYLEPLALDPHRQGYWETFRVSRNIMESLVDEDLTDTSGPTELKPGLATKWETPDGGKTWTFTLREGVKFHDGSDFDAESVHKNVRRITDPDYEFYDEVGAGQTSVWFDRLAEGRVVDDYTYEFEFDEPFLGFPRILAQSMSTLTIGNPAVWEKVGNDKFADQPEGTGPYKFVSRKIGDRIVLEKNKDYWGKAPYLDELVFRVIPNNQTRLAALLSGEVDLISYVQTEDVETLESQDFIVPEGHGAAYLYLTFNFKNEKFQDQRVRQALLQGVDRQKLIDELYSGHAVELGSWYPPGNEAYDPDEQDFEYDKDAAKKLLAEAGYDKSNPLSFTIVSDVANQNKAEWLHSELKGIGVETKVVALDRPSYGARTWAGNPEPDDGIHIDEYGGTYAEWLEQAYVSYAPKGLELDDYPDVQKAIEKARTTDDADQRIELWQEASRLTSSKALAIPTLSFTRYYAHSPNVKGFVWPATNWYDLSAVWLDN